jgi:hypothetical protein
MLHTIGKVEPMRTRKRVSRSPYVATHVCRMGISIFSVSRCYFQPLALFIADNPSHFREEMVKKIETFVGTLVECYDLVGLGMSVVLEDKILVAKGCVLLKLRVLLHSGAVVYIQYCTLWTVLLGCTALYWWTPQRCAQYPQKDRT